ncbi:MAG: tRNA (adenosine(37)-N6)-threonylcarbamoyltransferase complex dimerization subunit type 1 TsaB [Candidatus Electryonea clarkiae]|nr:tRNA (adenosine(37)-N6)-threonylcarbamoyltransferase complex dimerization subunit type 1 TsaB [Candidatus Electryonea clarkiae]MDP8285686.1 tRNA (adenosine(37)-N6)-threonylcarbamoyltransferase complex dimerization subunit type 1 TsaB [Candidatus Electryonea clarkiae]
MKILAIDTSGQSTRWVGVENGEIVDPVEKIESRRHDAVMSIGIKDWLKQHQWQDMGAVAVVNGPGGYTGLRVGVAFASALASGLGLPIIPISTYEAVAARAPGKTVWVLLPLRRGICRCRLMKGESFPEPLAEPEEFVVGKSEPPDVSPLLPLGDGYDLYKQEIDSLLVNKEIESFPDILPSNEALGRVVWEAWQRGRTMEPVDIDVDYGAEFAPTLKSN